MKLFLVILLEEGDDLTVLTERLVDTMTSMGFLHGYQLHYERVGSTLLVYRRRFS